MYSYNPLLSTIKVRMEKAQITLPLWNPNKASSQNKWETPKWEPRRWLPLSATPRHLDAQQNTQASLHKTYNPNTRRGKNIQVFLSSLDGSSAFTTSLRLDKSFMIVLQSSNLTPRCRPTGVVVRTGNLPLMVFRPKSPHRLAYPCDSLF